MQINPECRECPLWETAKTVCMAGTGPKDARVVIVGEAPGREEDEAGEPFIGSSGKLLTQVLEEAGINRDDCYITNAVKCRPPNNETPTPAQIGKCRPYLTSELDALNPKVILVLGNVPLKAVTGVSGITKARADTHRRGEVPIVATFHPAYALRSPDKLDDIKLDVRRAATYLSARPQEKITWVWGHADEADPLDPNAPLWAFDIETNGADIGAEDFQILLLGVTDGKHTVVYDQKNIRLGVGRIRDQQHRRGNKFRLFGHNSIGFDSEAIVRALEVYLPCDDTLILAHQIDERIGTAEAHGKGKLESLACAWLNVPPWKHQVTWDWNTISSDELVKAAQYNAEDAVYTFRLAELLLQKAEALEVTRGYEISKGAAIVFEHFVNNGGIEYHVEKAAALRGELTADALDAQVHIQELLGRELNLQSPKQVAQALYGDLELEPHHFTKSGQPSTDELSIKSLLVEIAGRNYVRQESVLRALLKYRENRKLVQFIESYDSLQVGGRLYPEYSVTSTVTYRTSSYNPNVQQWPHDERVRRLLTARRGHVLIEADYSQIEMRLASDEAKSAGMMDVFLKGIDIHTATASLITNKALELVTENERYVAKPVNFGLLYGGDIFTLKKQALLDYDLVLSDEDARRYHDAFHSAYGLETWYARIARELRETGQVRNRIGRIRHLPNFFSADPKARLEALRQGINFPVQSFACDVALVALMRAVTHGLNVVAFIHDAIYVEVREDLVSQAVDKLRKIMTEEVPQILAEEFRAPIKVPLAVGIKRGQDEL